jgi:hypothetical protein
MNRLDEARSWKPRSPGDFLRGVLVEEREHSTEFGPCRVALIRSSSGNLRAVWLCPRHLRALWDEAQIAEGDRLQVTYAGWGEAPEHPFHLFWLTHKPEGDDLTKLGSTPANI